MGDPGLSPVLGRSPGGGHGNPLQYSFLENLHGQRSLVGYSPWGCNESAMAGQLSTAQRTGLLESFLGENVFVNENVNERWESQDFSE